jgi:DNA-binding transcriptional LysR family regulator
MYTNGAAPVDKAIERFNELAPKVLLHIEIASPQDLLQRLLDGRYSLILTPTKELHPSVVSIALFDEEQRLYCGVRHPLFHQAKPSSKDELLKYPYVARTYMKGTAQARDEIFNHAAMTSHMEAIAILINSGKYIGYLPEHFARSFVEAKTMKSVLDDQLAYNDTFYLAHRRDEWSRPARALFDCLKNALKAGGV